ncbi:MAG: glycosyl hydrolase family 18 protein [Bacillota bacterium]|nr:glycosyl hydrolase family 18 protein [Bacillota bacterium]
MVIHKNRAVVLGIFLVVLAAAFLSYPGLMTNTGEKTDKTNPGHSPYIPEFIDAHIEQPKVALAAPLEKGTGEDTEESGVPNQEEQGKTQPQGADRPSQPEERGSSGRKNEASWLGEQYVLGFYVDKEYGHPSSYSGMVNNAKLISAVAPFWYRLSPEDGSKLQEHHPYDGFTDEDLKGVINKAHSQNIEVLMLVHNLLYGGQANGKELARQMLKTAESRKVFIDEIEKKIKEYKYDGVNIDIENIPLEDRDRFSSLMKELYERLSPQGYKVTVSVPAKTGDNRSNSWSGPFDYKEIGKYSDYVAIMTYDEHGYSSGPGPVASYNWVRDVMRYTVKEIPASKVLIGIPGYGFDWTVGQKGPRYISYSQAIETAASRRVDIQWDNTAKVPYYKYKDDNGKMHEVWFESKYSLDYKLNIAKEFNTAGIALWRIGLEDKGMWDVIGNRIKAVK